jgi:putative transcriptional regulator
MENKIESLRGDLGWTQQELADQAGVSRQTIISLENGRYNPSILLAFRLAKIFNQTIESIFIYNNEE